MPKNPSPPFSGRSWELPACLRASARSSCPKALPKNCTLCLKSSHIQNDMKFSPALSQQGREIAHATLPFPAEQRQPFVLCHSLMASEWGGVGGDGKLPFLCREPGLQHISNMWIFTISRRGFANKRRTEFYFRHASSWKLSNPLLLFPTPKCPHLEEKKCFSSVGTSLMHACIAHTVS